MGARLFEYHAYGHSTGWLEWPNRERPPQLVGHETLWSLRGGGRMVPCGTRTFDDGCVSVTEWVRVRAEAEPGSCTYRRPEWPERCPVTGAPFFISVDHPTRGLVPTYGGPLDSYTLAESDGHGGYERERYDHDAGRWVEWEDVQP